MDASFVPIKSRTNEAYTVVTPVSCEISSSSSSHSENNTETPNQSNELVPKQKNIGLRNVLISTQYIKHNNPIKPNESPIQDSGTTWQKESSNVTAPTNPTTSITQSIYIDSSIKDICSSIENSDRHLTQHRTDINSHTNSCSVRSASSPQLTIKPLTRSKVYRKASLKSMSSSNSISDHSCLRNACKTNVLTSEVRIINISNCTVTSTDKKVSLSYSSKKGLNDKEKRSDSTDAKNKWNMEDVHITCNPLSTPYPYSTPHHNIASETVMEPSDEEPKGRSCGSFLPILSLIPQTVISFQYLSPKMKFSWWRNKIS